MKLGGTPLEKSVTTHRRSMITLPSFARRARAETHVEHGELLLSVEQRRAFNQEIDVGIQTARQLLNSLPLRGLSQDQRAAIKRIRAFIRQAQESRDHDLALAKNLAVRARVLAEDLASSGR